MLSLKVQPLAYNHNGRNESMEESLDRSSHELQLLANFYHQHAFRNRAQELYRVVLRLRKDRDRQRQGIV